ncbi:MarR family winged helix-turn-helix transcriptional regulator [Actinomycetospora aeridis]|uniref:MarR family transcriptional regulator n=1 Tax=Actinomycetospora aeridis TaxID=3129231 RepID=A0ABU8NAL0_9PSEU
MVDGPREDSLFAPGRRARVLQLLHDYADAHVEATRHLAAALGVHATDAVAAAEILWAENSGTPLTPARLGERIGLTSGATTNLLHRLDAAGLVVRGRSDHDRRAVTLRLSDDARTRTIAFFTPTGDQVDHVLDRYDDATLERVEALLGEVVDVTTTRNAHLRRHHP